MSKPCRYHLTLAPTPDPADPDGSQRLRAALKVLLRRHGLRCVNITSNHQQGNPLMAYLLTEPKKACVRTGYIKTERREVEVEVFSCIIYSEGAGKMPIELYRCEGRKLRREEVCLGRLYCPEQPEYEVHVKWSAQEPKSIY